MTASDGNRVEVWWRLAVSNGVPRRAMIVALVVGPLLTLINQGDAIASGGEINWLKAGLTFLVPYVVATVGAVGAGRGVKGTAKSAPSVPCNAEPARLSSARSATQDSARESPENSGVQSVKARVHVTLKNGVLDPQGKAIEHALADLGFQGVEDVRQGKVIEFSLDESDPEHARAAVEAMCEKLLANTVIENYAIELDV